MDTPKIKPRLVDPLMFPSHSGGGSVNYMTYTNQLETYLKNINLIHLTVVIFLIATTAILYRRYNKKQEAIKAAEEEKKMKEEQAEKAAGSHAGGGYYDEHGNYYEYNNKQHMLEGSYSDIDLQQPVPYGEGFSSPSGHHQSPPGFNPNNGVYIPETRPEVNVMSRHFVTNPYHQ